MGNAATLSVPEELSDGHRSFRRSNEPDLRENVGVNAVNRRIGKNWSDGTLSARSGIKPERINKILRGSVFPTPNETQQLADAFDCTMKELQTKKD